MKRIEFEKFLPILSSELYSFAYVLLPDDLQAGQLVVDSIQAYLIQKREYIETLFSNKNKDNHFEFNKIKKETLQLVYELAKKRFHQIRLSIEETEDKKDFFHFEFDEKAALFLKDKMKMTNDEISILMMKTKIEVLSSLFSARSKMMRIVPYVSADEARS